MFKKRIWKIIRETKVIEEFVGLFILVFVFSYIFYRIEPTIETYGDGIWYSFALVTTTGFGDYVVVTPLGRILSIILGFYGIFIIAIVTSVIVNFYQQKIKDESK